MLVLNIPAFIRTLSVQVTINTKVFPGVPTLLAHFPGRRPLGRSLMCMMMTITWLFKSFEFGNGSRMSDKKLVIIEVKYLQNKKW